MQVVMEMLQLPPSLPVPGCFISKHFLHNHLNKHIVKNYLHAQIAELDCQDFIHEGTVL